MIPSCFCAFATNMAKYDFQLFLQSLAHNHPGVNVILFVDEEIHQLIREKLSSINLTLDIIVNLNEYTNKTRSEMMELKIWTNFQMIKSNLIEYCLTTFPNTLYLDSDIFIINKIEINNVNNYDLILSPHYISQDKCDLYGYYNGGVVWTSNALFPQKWRESTLHSRYYDQTALEECSVYFNTGTLGENFNFGWWRLNYSSENYQIICSYLSYDNQNIYYKNMPIIFFHTHFSDMDEFGVFNNLIKNALANIEEKHYFSKLLNM